MTDFSSIIADPDGFVPTPRLRWAINKNTRKTAREEAIAAEVLTQANPRENITGHFPWGPEEVLGLQQLFIHPETKETDWREVPTKGAGDLFTVEETEDGPLPVPNALKEPGQVQGDFGQRLDELIGGDQ